MLEGLIYSSGLQRLTFDTSCLNGRCFPAKLHLHVNLRSKHSNGSNVHFTSVKHSRITFFKKKRKKEKHSFFLLGNLPSECICQLSFWPEGLWLPSVYLAPRLHSIPPHHSQPQKSKTLLSLKLFPSLIKLRQRKIIKENKNKLLLADVNPGQQSISVKVCMDQQMRQ